MALLVETMIFSLDEICEVYLEVVGVVIFLDFRQSCFFFFLSFQYFLRPYRLNVLPVFTDSIKQAILVLKLIDFSLVFIDKFLVVLLSQQLLLHCVDHLFK